MALTVAKGSTTKYIGASGDTKPTAATHGTLPGGTFYEYDTGIMYITHDGTNWVEKDTIVRLETSPSIDIGDVTLLAGTAAIGKLATNSGVDIGDVDIGGGLVAHDAADSGNPIKIGTKVERSAPSEMADADRSDVFSDNFGNLYIASGQKLTYASIDKTTTAAQDIVAAPSAGFHLRIYGYTISNEGTEQATATITSVASFSTKDGSSINYHLPGYIDLASATACQATLSTTSTNGVIVGVYYRTMAD
ncbi:hypothetical protein LCGC14_0567280 [marine sediment metagenome]|uniref:Uncharacterized protein n=1 Tax=marine sediment metagenome TaxID=412755 RepID=A0A0F9U6L4_9ZZZZ